MEGCCHCRENTPCAAKIGIFQQLDLESQRRVSALAVHKQLEKGALLFSPEENPGLYLLSQGRVKVYSLSDSGKETLIRVLREGDFVGEEALFGSGETCTYGEALTSARVCLIPREAFLKLLNQYPSISLKLLEEMNRRLQALTRQTAAESGSQVKSRLIRYLLELSDAQQTQTVTLPLSGKELAHFLGTTPETLSRRWSALEKERLVSKKGKQVSLLDKGRLEESAQ